MSSEPNTNSDQMDRLLALFTETIREKGPGNAELELEVRFGTRGIKPMTKIDYDNIVRKLISSGYNLSEQDDSTILRMSQEYVDTRTGLTKTSNMRVELNGTEAVQQYCRTNEIEQLADSPVCNFVVKRPVINSGVKIEPVNVDDWNFRLSLSEEKHQSKHGNTVENVVRDWGNSKKTFRLITRNSLTKADNPLIRVDMSVVKESRRRGRNLLTAYTFESSGVTDSVPRYEVEFEIVPLGVWRLLEANRMDVLHVAEQIKQQLKAMVMTILSATQGTNFPISYPAQKTALLNYMQLIHGKDVDESKRIQTRDFIGPSSFTLSVRNIVPVNPDAVVPNIRENYTVTDKADGERKLMYIDDAGKVFLIDTNMRVQFTGMVSDNKLVHNTLIDGEHILNDKLGRFINLYAAFDAYFINKKDIRKLAFVPTRTAKEGVEDKRELAKSYRLQALLEVVNQLNLKSVSAINSSPIRVKVKGFYTADDKQSIFQCCSILMRKVVDGLFEYETDGLIFTPTNLGVGMNSTRDEVKNVRVTWEHSFKWKPTEFNTIDFLVSTKKTESGQEFVGNIFQEGTDLSSATQIQQYKTLILRVGFDERKHGYINPCQDIIDDKVVSAGDKDDEQDYRPMQFFPTNPYQPEAGVCNVMLDGSLENKVMMTQEGEVFGDNTIVEFRFDMDRKEGWRWVPLRVRYDKTAEFLAGGRNFGNAYHVANSNWHSIHNPITVDNITSGRGIPEEFDDDEVYYNRVTSDSLTRGLRDFHNLYVKKLLITSTAKRGGTLIDMACGKAGDLPKWIASRVAFVFGVDYSKDNIENRLDGACARYLNFRKKFSVMPDALFVHGDSTQNIRSGGAVYTEKGQQITRAIFGQGPRDAGVLGKGVYKQYGKGEKGFDLTSIQFSIHYMYKNRQTLHNTMRNISECTKVGGYFVSTQYDGKTVFNRLRRVKQGDSLTIMEDGRKLWEVTKQYDAASFPDDESSVGYAIDVYQETINKVFTEYLVNYEYTVRVMEDYGFVPLTRDESRRLGLKASSGMFQDLFDRMKNEIRGDPELESQYGTSLLMTEGERQISFLNRWMVFKKVRDVDAEKVCRLALGQTVEEVKRQAEEEEKASEAVEEVVQEVKTITRVRKLKKKVKLVLLE